jgi:hypothetical protein
MSKQSPGNGEANEDDFEKRFLEVLRRFGGSPRVANFAFQDFG